MIDAASTTADERHEILSTLVGSIRRTPHDEEQLRAIAEIESAVLRVPGVLHLYPPAATRFFRSRTPARRQTATIDYPVSMCAAIGLVRIDIGIAEAAGSRDVTLRVASAAGRVLAELYPSWSPRIVATVVSIGP